MATGNITTITLTINNSVVENGMEDSTNDSSDINLDLNTTGITIVVENSDNTTEIIQIVEDLHRNNRTVNFTRIGEEDTNNTSENKKGTSIAYFPPSDFKILLNYKNDSLK